MQLIISLNKIGIVMTKNVGNCNKEIKWLYQILQRTIKKYIQGISNSDFLSCLTHA